MICVCEFCHLSGIERAWDTSVFMKDEFKGWALKASLDREEGAARMAREAGGKGKERMTVVLIIY